MRPASATPLVVLATIYAGYGDLVSATSNCEQAIKTDPADISAAQSCGPFLHAGPNAILCMWSSTSSPLVIKLAGRLKDIGLNAQLVAAPIPKPNALLYGPNTDQKTVYKVVASAELAGIQLIRIRSEKLGQQKFAICYVPQAKATSSRVK